MEQSLPSGKVDPVIPQQRFKRRERWWAALFFALAVVLAFPQVVFLGRSLVPTDNYNPLEYTFNETNYGPNFIPPEEWGSRGLHLYPNLHDPGGDWWQGEPALEFFRKSIYSGQFPFWDPSAAAGAPAYSNLQCQFLFPPQVVLSLLGSTSAQKNIYILFLFWAAGFTTYCLLRMHGLAQLASAAGGLVFLFSGALQQLGPCMFLGQVVACMPLLLLVTRWFIDQPTWRRVMGLAATYAAVSLASFPPILCAAFGGAVFYFLVALALEKASSRARLVSRFSVSVALSLGMVAVYYLPAFLTIARTQYVTQWYKGAAADVLALRCLFDLFSPTATGGALVYSSPIMGRPDAGHLYYIGAAGLLLAGLAFGRSKGKSRTLLVSCSVLAALTLLKIFGVPPVQWIALLPGAQNVHFHLYFGILVALLLSLLAALGFERLLLGRPVIQLLVSLGVFGASARVLWVLARDSGALVPYSAWRWIADFRMLMVFAAIFALLAGVMLLRNQWNKAAKVAGYLLLALIFVEGVTNATYPRQRRWDIFAHPAKYVSAAQKVERPARLFTGAALNANLASAFGLESLDSLYMFSPPRMYDIYYKYAQPAAAISMREATALPPDNVLDRSGISHVLVRRVLPIILPTAKLRQYPVAYEDDYVALFQRPSTARYLFSSDYQVVDRKKALQLIGTAPARSIILERDPGFPASANLPTDPAPELVSAKLNSLTVRLHSPRPGLLYVADAFYNGWSATVNGRRSEILPANYGFRAVSIPEGEVLVRFSYLPSGFLAGLAISMTSLAIAAALGLRKRLFGSN